MQLYIHLRDTKTGHRGVYEMDWRPGLDGLRYQFGEGNYGCDCNRAIFLAEVSKAFDDLEEGEIRCSGQTNRIAIDRITDMHGRLLYGDEVAA